MTATDELRLPNDTNELDMLLSERGQEHRVWPSGRVVWYDECTVYEYEPAKNHHDEYWGGILRMTMRHLTPAQVIAATLGQGTCKRLWTGSEMICSECAHQLNDPTANFCSNCGREVVDDENRVLHREHATRHALRNSRRT